MWSFSLWLLVWTTNGQKYRTAESLNRAEHTAWLVFTNRSSEILICNNCTAGDDGPQVPTYHYYSDFYVIAEQITLFYQEVVGLKCHFLYSRDDSGSSFWKQDFWSIWGENCRLRLTLFAFSKQPQTVLRLWMFLLIRCSSVTSPTPFNLLLLVCCLSNKELSVCKPRLIKLRVRTSRSHPTETPTLILSIVCSGVLLRAFFFGPKLCSL